MINGEGYAFAAEAGHEFGRLLDRLRPVIIGSRWSIGASAAASRADHRRSRLSQRGGNATAGAARRARHHGDTSGKRAFT